METTALVVSILFTIGILVLTLITISKGYGYKHTVDPIDKKQNQLDVENEENLEK